MAPLRSQARALTGVYAGSRAGTAMSHEGDQLYGQTLRGTREAHAGSDGHERKAASG